MAFFALTLATMGLGAPMTVDVNHDRINDRASAVATLRSGDDRLEFGCTPYEPRRVWWRLRSHRWFRGGDPIDGNIAFRVRFDDHDSQRLTWSVRERTAMLVGRGRVQRFAQWVIGSRQLIVRTRGPERRRYDITFELDGAREAISRALEACGDTFRNRLDR